MRRLVVVRPEPGASATVGRATAMGLEAVAMPLFEVEAIAWEAPGAGDYDALLLTSANALRHGGDGLQKLRGLPVYAVGDATADEARRAGFTVAICGDGDVERLLRSIPDSARLLHLCGEHRTVAPSPHSVTEVAVYRSRELLAPADLRLVDGQTAAVQSPRAGRRLAELIDAAGIERSGLRIAAISDAAAEAAGEGWAMRVAADRPSDAALLAVAARLCDNRNDQ
jgi:uroporphyrinogen-III synthase